MSADETVRDALVDIDAPFAESIKRVPVSPVLLREAASLLRAYHASNTNALAVALSVVADSPTISDPTRPPVLDVTARNGVPFRVVFCEAGQAGPNPHRHGADSTHATVEVYDRRYPHTEHGQFTGGYYHIDTLMGRDQWSRGNVGYGLNLDGGVEDWTIDAETMRVVRAWLQSCEQAAEWRAARAAREAAEAAARTDVEA